MDRVINSTTWESWHENRWLYWLPVLVYAGAIYYLSSLPNPTRQLPSFIGQVNDKVIHFLEYGLLGILFYRALRWAAGPWIASQALWLAVSGTVLYGITDEIHQAFVPPRAADLFDVMADATGAMVAIFGWRRLTDPASRVR